MGDSNAQEVKKLDLQVEKLRVILSDNNENWRPRIDAMATLIEVINSGLTNVSGFTSLFGNSLWSIADPLVTQLGDLRSEITSTASQTICFLAETFGSKFARPAGKMMPGMIALSGATNNLIRGHVRECMTAIFKEVHSKTILNAVVDELKKTKSKYVRDACSDYLLMMLETWPLEKYRTSAAPIEEVIVQGLKARTPETRETSARCVSLFLHAYPERRTLLLGTLDARAKRLVEKILDSEDPELDDAHFNEIRKGLASRDGDGKMQGGQMGELGLSKLKLNRPNSMARVRSSLTPKSDRRKMSESPSGRSYGNSYSSQFEEPPSPSGRLERENSISSGRRRGSARHINADEGHLEKGGLSRPHSTTSTGGRPSNIRRSVSFDHEMQASGRLNSGRQSGRVRSRPKTTQAIPATLSEEEKKRLTQLYNEHQNYLARSAVNLKDLHTQLTAGRLKQPLDTYLSMTIHHVDMQLEMAQQLKNQFEAFRKQRKALDDDD